MFLDNYGCSFLILYPNSRSDSFLRLVTLWKSQCTHSKIYFFILHFECIFFLAPYIDILKHIGYIYFLNVDAFYFPIFKSHIH